MVWVLVYVGLNVFCWKGSEYEKVIFFGLDKLVVYYGLDNLELCFFWNNLSFSKLMENFVSYGVKYKKINLLVLGMRWSLLKRENDGNCNRVFLLVLEVKKIVIFYWDFD